MTFFRFADPWWLFILAVIPILVYFHFNRKGRGSASIQFSHLGHLASASKPSAGRSREILFWLRMAALAVLSLALARPQSGMKGEEAITQGIDIVVTLDISSTMLAEDIKPNRVDAAKAVAAEFIKGRKNDRIGMVVFSGDAYTQCPLTIDYGILLSLLDQVHVGMIEDGTAIGMGLATAVNRIRSSESKSKVIILLTDGNNNRGSIDPITAAQAAQVFDIRIYTIGAGTQGTAMFPVDDPFFGRRYAPMRVEIDENLLKRIASLTGGKYFRATDRESLERIWREIDAMEKTKIKVKEYTRYSEKFFWYAGLALALLLAEIVLANTRLERFLKHKYEIHKKGNSDYFCIKNIDNIYNWIINNEKNKR